MYRYTHRTLISARFFILLILFLLPVVPLYSQASDEEDFEGLDLGADPRFSRPSTGGGIGFGFNLTGLKPSALDPSLKGDLILTNLDVFFINNGLMLGGSWTTSTLYDAPERYEEFDFNYRGGIVGYQHSLFYGKLTLRPSVFLGQMNVKLITRRPDITADPMLNPDGRPILERIWEDDSFTLRPAFGIGWAPIDFFQFRAEVGFLYPTGDGRWEDLREPLYSLQFVLGSNR